ncbi:hypothetical protein MauCBS54593_001979 [Microsporum audouinii]
MADTVMGDDAHNPHIEQPDLRDSSAPVNASVATVAAEAPKDDESDFYNTPLNAGTALPPNNVVFTKDEVMTEERSESPHATIPGLSLCSEERRPGSGIPPQQTPSEPAQNTIETASEKASATDTVMSSDGTEGSKATDSGTVGVSSAKEALDTVPSAPRTAEDDIAALAAEMIEGIPPTVDRGDQPQEDNHPEWEVDSSPYESSSDSSTDSSSSDSSDNEDDDDDYELLDPEEQARLLMATEGGSDDEGSSGRAAATEVRTANEKPDEVVPMPDITITPEMKIEMLGNIETIVDNVVLVRANISGEYQVLESGSVLCSVNLKVIGVVSETLGRVQQPLYTVRFPNAEAVKEAGLEKESPVFYVVDHSTFVFTEPLKGLKGSDASNLHDEEVGDEEIEFSDDEAEAEYKRQLKLKRQAKREGKVERGGGSKGKGSALPPSNLRHSELNYDDNSVDNDGYTRLSRPQNLHELMGSEAPMEMPHSADQHGERSFRGGRGRGRGRGNDRSGRGGRGGRGGYDRGSRQSSQGQGNRQSQPQHAEYSPQQHLSYQQNPYQQPSNPPFPHQSQPQTSGNMPNNFGNNSSGPYQPTFPSGAFQPQGLPQNPFQFSPPSNSPQPMFQYPPPGSHINPAFFLAMQQQQQQQQGTYYPAQTQPAPAQNQGLPNASVDSVAAVQAQLDILKRLTNGANSANGSLGN